MSSIYLPTQEDINNLKQRFREPIINLYLLDMELKTLKFVKGTLLSDNLSIDVDSEIRKTGSITLLVKNKEIDIGEEKNFWLNRLVKVEYCIYNETTNKELIYNRGIYVLTDYDISYSSTDYTISISLNDQVSLYNGDISGGLGIFTTTINRIPVEDCKTVRDAMLHICELANITNYRIEENKKEFPYDMDFSNSQTIWDMVVGVRDLYPGWETFFDIDGFFVFQPIPTCENDPVVLDEEVLGDITINESVSVSFLSIKNISKVWGKCLDTDYTADSVTYDNGTYTATFTALPIEDNGELSTGVKLAIEVPNNNIENPKIIIKNIKDGSTTTVGTFDIVDDSENGLKTNIMEANSTYLIKYRRKKMYYMGQYQINYCCILVAAEPTDDEKKRDCEVQGTKNIMYTVNPDSPFCREYIGERVQVLTDGDCDQINSDQKAKERAEWENWTSARMSYSLTLNCLYVPFLYGNEKILYKLKSTGELKEWIIKSISGSWIDHTMSLTLSEFYPYYPFVVQD